MSADLVLAFSGLMFTIVTAILAVVWRSSTKLDRVHQQVIPNGGSSLRDDVTQIRAVQGTLVQDVEELRSSIGSVHRRLDQHIDQHRT